MRSRAPFGVTAVLSAALALAACGGGGASGQSAGIALAGGPGIETGAGAGATTSASSVADNGPADWRQPGWIAKENAKAGTGDWRVGDRAETYDAVRGFAGVTSVAVGESFELYVNSADSWHVEAYRVGWYGGAGGRLVWRSEDRPAHLQAAPVTDPATNMREAPWQASLTVSTAGEWPPGTYLLKLVSQAGASYVPITVRDDSSEADIVVIGGVTTWQAYNGFGGASLYSTPTAPRSNVVSFDRPYGGTGAGSFLDRERSFVLLAERYGYDVTYVTDIDVHLRPELLQHHRAIVSPGHDEYYSPEMRAALLDAREAGVNHAFLGANAVWRKVRFESSPTGPLRRMVNYRTMADPVAKTDPDALTVNWSEAPFRAPSTQITGGYTECTAIGDWVVSDASSWLFAGTGMSNGTVVKGLIGHEFDRVRPELGLPGPTHVFSHSPMTCADGRRTFADSNYTTVASGAGILNAGTLYWARNLAKPCPDTAPAGDPCRIQRLVRNVLDVFAAGPAGLTHPAEDNLPQLGIAADDGAPPEDHD